MSLANINEPSILGFAITPWLIILSISLIGSIVLLILIMLALVKKSKKEAELIEKAAANILKISVKDIDITSLALNAKESTETEGFPDISESVEKTEFDISDLTEGLDVRTEDFLGKEEQTSGLLISEETEALIIDDQTQDVDMGSPFFIDETEDLSEADSGRATDNNISTAKFCAQCGSKVIGKGNFCSHCGSKIV